MQSKFFRTPFRFICFAACLSFLFSCEPPKKMVDSNHQVKKYLKGYRVDKNGWIYLHIEGEPYERGKQYGYLVADTYKEAQAVYRYIAYTTTGMDLSFFIKQGVLLHKDKIPEEMLHEMEGIADGLKEAGVEASLDDIIGWNSWMEVTSNWWPKNKKKYTSSAPLGQKSRCSAFIATGSATKDGKIVIGHSTFDDFWNAPFDRVILDIKPSQGFGILMQTQPCYLASMEDFFITTAGIVGVETTMSGFNGYDEGGSPIYVRARKAMQYGSTIDEFVQLLNTENNGAIAAVWLIGDINQNEIAQYEQGLLYQNLQKKKDGGFFGSNTVDDPRIRNLECSFTGYSDVRRHTGARRTRWPQVFEKYFGNIDAEVGKAMLSDHYDLYKERNMPSATTICAHYDEDSRSSMSSSQIGDDPYSPGGSIDAKITTADLAREMKILARFGRACGKSFDAKRFLKDHPQWSWQKDVLKSRPSQSWTLFSSGGENE